MATTIADLTDTAPAATHDLAAQVRAGHRDYLFPAEARYYDEPIVLVRGRGVWLEDAKGDTYLDLFSGILTNSVGQAHPEVVARVTEQLNTLGHTSTLYLNENEVAMAERLARIAPGRLDRTFFTNSGTEAIETAIMLAQIHTGRSEIFALRYSYSGRSTLATNLTAHASWRPLPSSISIKHVLSPYPYRCHFKQPCDESCVEAYARDLEEAIVTTTNGQPAAFLAETIQGVGGYIVPPKGYFQRMAEVIRKYGGLLIIDEVQTGFGRTGNHWFGIEHWGVEPDIMVMAKGIANGFPVGATMTRTEIAASWKAKTLSTYGGNPISMAAAIATHDIMVRENVPAIAQQRGAQLRAGLQDLASKYEWIGDVRGMGLMMALELVQDRTSKTPSPKHAKLLLEAAKAEGILIGVGGLNGHIMRIGPSLLITEDEIAEGLRRLERAAARVPRQP
jgi:alanine-glyoxylate transaminase / (R)-3-amino-2-methylpropionate-pyruvate transaminase